MYTEPRDHHLPFILRGAIGSVVDNAVLADQVTKIVLNALDNYEDERFLAILKQNEEDTPVDIAKIRNTLES